jgi:hypothetical protein
MLVVFAEEGSRGPTVLTEQVAGRRWWHRRAWFRPPGGSLGCDLVIVDMPDTLLVTTRARSQEVKRLVKRAKESGWRKLL